jgi:Na+-transporting NADH:ubiquinone oxidoreductase subunit NqrF
MLVSTLLAVALSLPFGMKTALVLNYLANTSYYSTELCENKNAPELNCNGKCHLSKEIKAIEQPAEDVPGLMELVKVEISPFITSIQDFNLSNELYSEQKKYNAYPFITSTSYVKGIFHPPRI